MKQLIQSIVICTIACMLMSAGCNNIKELEYKGIAKTELNTLSFNQAAIRINLSYYNPNKFGIDVKETNLSVYLNDQFIGIADQPEKTMIPRQADFQFPVVVHFDPIKVLGTAFKSLFSKTNKVTLQGSARLGKGGMYLKVPVQISEQVSLFSK
ncbi:MAG: LEA type 2 family protein [Bacteroidetes bacterium]|nr:LEA type 2 family protein [Bacteroidota bacterium]